MIHMKGKLIGQGRTAEVYEWGDKDILKLFRKEIPLEAIDNEYKIASIVWKYGLPAPAAVEKICVEDRYGIICEKISGKTMMKVIALSPWKVKREARRLAALHYEIHQYKAEGLPSQKNILRKNIESVDLLSEDKKKKVIKYLEELPEKNMLCHSDFHPDNILISKNRAVVIDWMTGTEGSPAADVARTSIMLRTGSIPSSIPFLFKMIIENLRSKLYSEYIDYYLKLSNFTIEEIEDWELPIAAARLLEWLPKEEKDVLLKVIDEHLDKIGK